MTKAAIGVFDLSQERKARGAFFTPPAIAEFLARQAISGRPNAKVLDPTCGDGAFLIAAAQVLRALGRSNNRISEQIFGVDIHSPSLDDASTLLNSEDFDATLLERNFFELEPPGGLLEGLPEFDAVIGNPPFVRYQQHSGSARTASASAALRQGVRLSGLASSWAALLVHAGGFLKPDGRLAMVLPAELLTVGYAEPVRLWLRSRFASVKLVLFERLQFDGALENVVLVMAQGSGGCDAFSLYYVNDAEDLKRIQPFDEFAVTFSSGGKWTDLLLSMPERQAFKSIMEIGFSALGTYGAPELGTVTGANQYFTLNESTRSRYRLEESRDVIPISPPGTRHLHGVSFTQADWRRLRDDGEAVWMLCPEPDGTLTSGLRRYLKVGEELGVPEAYKCRVRSTWYRPPAVSPPDLFFTYMSHRYPRLIANKAKVTFVNSMHGLRLVDGAPRISRDALPLLSLNSVTMLGAELYGRSYGGGILKMEPREAASLPVPSPEALEPAWEVLRKERTALNRQLCKGEWSKVVDRVDDVLLNDVLALVPHEIKMMRAAGQKLRARRLARSPSSPVVNQS